MFSTTRVRSLSIVARLHERTPGGDFAVDAADVLHRQGALVEQRDDAAVHFVDRQAVFLKLRLSFFRGHAAAPNPLLSSRGKASSSVSSAGLSACCPIRRTNALPTTTASTCRPSSATCAGWEMPKPTARGRSVTARTA